MKCIVSLILAAGYASAQSTPSSFTTGQAARAVIGQSTFTRQEFTAAANVLGGVGGIAYVNDTLIVADSNRPQASPQNNRVLIYRNISTKVPGSVARLPYDIKCPVCRGDADVVLGQKDFVSNQPTPDPVNTPGSKPTASGLRTPTAVASNGVVLAVADTDNNRVLIWNTLPTVNNKPADVVIGQPNFTTATIPQLPTAKSMRGPQGVWIGGGKLFVADTQNHRVLIYNSIPTTSGQAADVVLGQKDFVSFAESDPTKQKTDATGKDLLNPVSVSTDGVRLYVADLGYNRVLIWNSIPTGNQQPADISVGQPDLVSSLPNNSAALCDSNGVDTAGAKTYPATCNATVSFPRFALSDGKRLFVADGGNDRVLIYNTIPARSGVSADIILGQIGGGVNQASDAADSLRTPDSLAWDGLNLYVSDTFNRRVNVYSEAPSLVPYQGVRNAASLQVYAVGALTVAGAIQDKDTVTLAITSKDYTTASTDTSLKREYKVAIKKDDTVKIIATALVNLINAGAGDKDVLAILNPGTLGIILTSRVAGEDGNSVGYAITLSTNAVISVTTAGATLSGGQDAAKIGPGSLVAVQGVDLTDFTAQAPGTTDEYPTELANTQVYFNGIAAPLFLVSPTEVRAQVPFEVFDTTSVNAYVRAVRKDGRVTVSAPVAVTIVPQNPGIFTDPASTLKDPRPGLIYHGSSSATGTISVDGSVQPGDVASVLIEDRKYTYTVVAGDTLASIRDNLIALINQDPKVEAFAAGSFTRIRLRARVQGPDGNGIAYSGSSDGAGSVIITATTPALCCASVAGALITDSNPAQPGETLLVYTTGLGLPKKVDDAQDTDPVYSALHTGVKYKGPVSEPAAFVSSLAGGKTANVLGASLLKNAVGIYEVVLELNSDLPTDPLTQMTIAQDVFVSNIVTFPVKNPTAPVE